MTNTSKKSSHRSDSKAYLTVGSGGGDDDDDDDDDEDVEADGAAAALAWRRT